MEASEPETKVNPITPKSIINIANILSILVVGVTSPYPTVQTVVKM